ncbi:MAG: YCF48-related protein [Bacteroidota bacterium]
MKTKLLFALLILSTSLTAQLEWQALPDAPNFIGDLSKLDDVYFINPQTGWTINSLGEVFKTEDGGETWANQGDLEEFLRCIQFANEDVGYAGSLQGNFGGPPSNSKFFKTIDGGDTWSDVTASMSPEPIGICGISVVNEDVVYGCGAFYGPARVYKTLDGGDTWTNIDMSAYAQALVDVYFYNENEGYVVGFGSITSPGAVVLKTVDGGENWETLFNDSEIALLWKIQVLDSLNLFASVAGNSMEGGAQILISNDGGINWTSKQVPVQGTQLQGVGFITPDHGFTGGFFDGLYETTDGGDTWQLIDIGANYNRFQKVNDTLMYASGHTIYKYSGSSVTSTREEIVQEPNYSLDVFPNPASDNLSISYTLGNNTHLKLELVDQRGKTVTSLFDGWHQKGAFDVDMDVSSLPAGAYLVVFLSREGDLMKKVLIQR